MNRDDPAKGFALIERIGADEYNRLLREHRRASIVATINGHEIWPGASADCMLSAERSGLSPRSRKRKRARGK